MRADQLAVVEMMGEISAKGRRIAELEAENERLRAALEMLERELDNEADCSEIDGPNVQAKILLRLHVLLERMDSK